MTSQLAIHGGAPLVSDTKPHFHWPPNVPGLSEKIKNYIDSGGALSIVDRSGVYKDLENRFCELLDRRYAILTSSGTMALYSAFFALDLKPEEEVISTVYSFHATTTPLLHLGVKIVFCDVEPDTGNIDPEKIADLITPNTRAVVTNHMWGHPVDIDKILGICRENGLVWVEDCSHAHFAQYNDKYVGTLGDISVFSLQGNKLLTGGEGGILLTDSVEIYDRATLLGHSLKRSVDCVHNPIWKDLLRTGFGLKLRMHPLAAVMILYLLENHCFQWIDMRAETLARFSEGLAASGMVQPMARRSYVTSMGAHYGFKPRIDFSTLGIGRETLVNVLRAEGLDVSVPGALPFHRLALFDCNRFPIGAFKKANNSNRSFFGAETYYESILSLPTFTFRSDWPLVDHYIDAFQKVLSHLEELK